VTGRRGPVLHVDTRSAEETRGIGGKIGSLLVCGDVVLLGGELGAGKTTFTQGVARAIGIKEPVTSPTFTLIRTYENRPGQLKLLHADVYRLEHVQEIIDLGLPELLEDESAAAVIEWGDKASPALLPEFLEVHFEFGEEADQRRLAMQAAGSRWAARIPLLQRVTGGPA
jgi:tRNA threonylcarbamoyladenosine biosynthesis protein TsaE